MPTRSFNVKPGASNRPGGKPATMPPNEGSVSLMVATSNDGRVCPNAATTPSVSTGKSKEFFTSSSREAPLIRVGQIQLQDHAGVGCDPQVLLIRPRDHSPMRHRPVVDLHLIPVLLVVADQHFELAWNRTSVDCSVRFVARDDACCRTRERANVG